QAFSGGDIFSASQPGTSKFTIGNDGTLTTAKYTANTGVLYTNGTGVVAQSNAGSNGQILTISGGVPTWTAAGGTINFWQEQNGALSPLNITDDLLLGATSTGSA